MRKLTIAILLTFIYIICAGTYVYAVDGPDEGPEVLRSIYMYRHCIEPDDLLLLCEYNIDYTVDPGIDIDDAFSTKFLDTDDSVIAVGGFYNYTGEYGRGVTSIYLTAAQVTTGSITWGSTGYKFVITGNPILPPPETWSGSLPYMESEDFEWSSATTYAETSEEVQSRVLELADRLEKDWDINLVNLGVSKLEENGASYFRTVIPNLWSIAPGLFLGNIKNVEIWEEDYDQGYAQELRDPSNPNNIWFGTKYADAFDDLAEYFDIPSILLRTGFYMVIMSVVFYALYRVAGEKGGPVLLLGLPLLPLGNMWGFISLELTILMTFMAVMVMGYIFFYRSTV